MTLTVQLPDDIATHEHPAREALEAIVIEAYRSEKLTQRQAARMLDLYWLDFEGLLKQRGVMEGAYDVESFQTDLKTLDFLDQNNFVGR